MQGLLQPNVCVTLSLLLLLLLQAPFQLNAQQARTNMEQTEFSRRLGIFALNLYDKIATLSPNQNIIFSPLSIQTCAAMARVGASGQTADELDAGLQLISKDAKTIGESFLPLMTAYANSNTTQIANKIYLKEYYQLSDEFSRLLNYFLASAENINFNNAIESARIINTWVEKKTNNLIKDLISPDSLNDATRLILINAIHFKGKWKHSFNERETRQEDFHLDDRNRKLVSMMNIKQNFRYADLPNLDATALELPYDNSDLSMVVVLPNKRTGLSQLEEKLRNVNLEQITDNMRTQEVRVKLPKFKSEFSVDLMDAFQLLGMQKLFRQDAEFDNMLNNKEHLYVSKIIHKAVIDVNEEGTEAAAATAIQVQFCMMPIFQPEPKHFYADHPFVYYIANSQGAVLFAGKLLSP